ncbi:MAG TPA: sugar phosphate isomerase/epimerase [Thermomicrobiales bacterium]|jgi:sugar phosphate isomerase/epimerase|nr:sugar phosphate isomerase/epimerase [Thermomicrobiales bacterium]
MTTTSRIRFATDLCTFYDPRYWGASGEGYADIDGLFDWGTWDPARFWARILDDVAAAGLDGIEITWGPGGWTSALAAYGSAEGFARDVADHGLEVCAGYLSTRDPQTGRQTDLMNPADHDTILAAVDGYAAFLAACGASVMVASPPLRTSRDASPPVFVDLAAVEPVASMFNRMGATAARHGVDLAVHPESFSWLRNSRDADLFMLLTDPTYVGLCPDAAQFTVGGSDPIEILRRHRDRVTLTHWKDATGPAPRDTPIDERIYETQIQWFAAVGQGVVDWPGWARTLRDIGYYGWAVFELDGATDPVADLRTIRGYVETSLGHLLR